MSASSKKKLRSEAAASKLTERQEAEKKEAAKLKIYTTAFVVVLVLLIVIAAVVGGTKAVSASGIRERKTTAVTIGSHEISNAELSYYFIDGINQFYQSYGSYASMLLDLTKPLDEQVVNDETGATWADDFLESAVSSACSIYALVDEANKEGYTLTEEDRRQIDNVSTTLDAYATVNNAESTDAYIKAVYGNGASKASYIDYITAQTIASSYLQYRQDNLTFTEEEIREADEANASAYNSYAYNQYYISASKYLTDGTVDENGATTYTLAQREAAAVAAELAAKELTSDAIASVEDFDKAIAELDINADSYAASTAYTAQRTDSMVNSLVDWLTDPARVAGDKTYVASNSTTTDENGESVEYVSGIYAVYYNGVSDNVSPLINVRHILVSFEGGTTANDVTVYSDEEKAAAKASAEEILAQWKAGEATEESFAALASEKTTDTGSSSNGGLYENVYPGQMVTAFNDWCFDESRNPGDTDIVETEYGYHVMYFVGTGDTNYRDFMVKNDLISSEMESWYSSLVDSMTVTNGDTSYIRTNITLSR